MGSFLCEEWDTEAMKVKRGEELELDEERIGVIGAKTLAGRRAVQCLLFCRTRLLPSISVSHDLSISHLYFSASDSCIR